MSLLRAISISLALAAGGIATSSLLVIAISPAAVPYEAAAQVVVSEQVPEPPQALPVVISASTTEGSIQGKIVAYASKWGVSDVLVRDLVSCETGGSFDPDIRSSAIYDFSRPAQGIEEGGRERSYGLAQIHLPDNQNISLEQAIDPDYALNFMAQELAAGNAWRWKRCFDSVGGSVYSAPVH